MTRNHLISPPAAHLAIRIGVTGHRPNRLTQADAALLRTKIGEVLEIVCHTAHDILAASGSAFAPGPPILRVISSLAEGADRIVAQEALDRGFELQCPLPFDRDEYEKDFETPESRAAYRAMLAKASAVLELDGSRETTERENASYEAVGRMVLQHTDVLIALWDGEEVAGKGGTGQIVQEAIGLGVSTVWLRSSVPHDVSLLVDDNDFKRRKRKLEGLSDQLRRLLLPPSPSPDRHQGQFFERLRRLLFPPTLDLRQQYFAEKQPSKTILGAFFKTFRDLIAEGKSGQLRWQLRDFEEATTAEWQQAWQASPGFPQVVSEQINCQYRTHYAWADKLADYYANLYRSSFVAIYLMGASAVLFALFTWVKPLQPLLGANTHEEAVWSVLELGLILLILLIYWLGIRRHWHKRWIDYRLLAEQLRHMRFLAPLGRTLPAFRVPAHDVHGDPRRSWVNWHFRAIAREAGLVNARIDTGYLEAYRQLLVGHEIKSQVSYHKDNARRFHTLDHRLHNLGYALFFLTLLACAFHIEYHSALLTFCAAVFPAFGAAIYGIRNQGEFQRIAERSGAMSVELDRTEKAVMDPDTVLSSSTLGQAADEAVEIMAAEVLDWRIVFQARPLVLPA